LLHSRDALKRPRPNLLGGLADLIRDTLVVVVGYGAWDDIFTGALAKLATARECEILWSFNSEDGSELRRSRKSLLERIGLTDGIIFYRGVDANELFRELLSGLESEEGSHASRPTTPLPATPGLQVKTAPRVEAVTKMAPEVLPIGDTGVTPGKYGPKAATLSTLMRNDIRVPEGFCIDLASSTVDELQEIGEMQRIWKALTKNSNGRAGHDSLIVRSSASVEDSPTALFPGRFASRRDVKTFTDLIVGINACVDSPTSLAVKEYQQMLGLRPESIHMSVIVQWQVPAVLAGVAFTAPPPPYNTCDLLVEMAEGEANALLTGDVTGSLYSFTRHDDQESYHHLAGPHIDTSQITSLVSSLSTACERIVRMLGEAQDIEWVWDGHDLYIVQARPIRAAAVGAGVGVGKAAPRERQGLPSLPMADSWGLKAAAAQYFGRSGWGASNAVVVPPRADRSEVEGILASRKNGPKGTVIRFSYEAHVGVAKRFIPPGGNVLEAFFETRANESWVGIVSDYVVVDSSFEAYVSDKTLLVEHVPGNWEPNNLLPPDVFLWTESKFEFLKVPFHREAAVEIPSVRSNPGVFRLNIGPLANEKAEHWAIRMVEYFSMIRSDLAPDLPVNVHFVIDKDDWYFLNIRPTTHLDVERSQRVAGEDFKMNRYFLVVNPEDVNDWDHQSRILVNCAADRGGVARIASVAASLQEAGLEEVFCTFGVLSHPAILLREFGLVVSPLYLDHEPHVLRVPRW